MFSFPVVPISRVEAAPISDFLLVLVPWFEAAPTGFQASIVTLWGFCSASVLFNLHNEALWAFTPVFHLNFKDPIFKISMHKITCTLAASHQTFAVFFKDMAS